MNKRLLFFFLLFWGILLRAQNENVVIDGVTFSADRKTLISYPRDKVNEEYIVPEGTEIIGKSAFSNQNLRRLTFPFSMKEIGDYALFCPYLILITWGHFPEKIGKSIFQESPIKEFYVSSENSNCIAVDDVLFSADKKILFRCPPGRAYSHYDVPEGTEVIHERAFERAKLDDVTLPSTLKTIKDAAFWVMEQIPTRSDDMDENLEYRHMHWVICKALTPPIIIGHPFAYPYYSELYVPEESYAAYCYAPGWTKFGQVNGNANPASVNNISAKGTKAHFEDFILNITSEQQITKVCVYNQIGALLREQEVGADSWFWNMEALHPQGLLLIRVVYDDFTEDVFKLIK